MICDADVRTKKTKQKKMLQRYSDSLEEDILLLKMSTFAIVFIYLYRHNAS